MSEAMVTSEYDFTKIPFDKIVRVGQRNLLYRDLFVVSWLLGRYCNYKCSYCWPYARADKPDHRPFELIAKTIDEIKLQSRARGFNSFHFSFSGGEPTFHPDYLRILEHLAQDAHACNYHSVHMTTNLSRPIPWFKQYVSATEKFSRVSITASFHKEFAKRDAFRDKLLFLQENEVNTTINMVMVPERFDLLWEDAMFFHNSGLNVTLKPQSNASASAIVDGYLPEQLARLQNGLPQLDFVKMGLKKRSDKSKRPPFRVPEQMREMPALAREQDDLSVSPLFQVEFIDRDGRKWYMDQAERFNAFNFNRFQGWDCSAGYRSLIIREPDGAIKRSYSCSDQPLGNIDTGFRLFDQVKPCMTRTCVSSADSKIPKRAPLNQAPLWPGDAPLVHSVEVKEGQREPINSR